jgi:hypothetical protein
MKAATSVQLDENQFALLAACKITQGEVKGRSPLANEILKLLGFFDRELPVESFMSPYLVEEWSSPTPWAQQIKQSFDILKEYALVQRGGKEGTIKREICKYTPQLYRNCKFALTFPVEIETI